MERLFLLFSLAPVFRGFVAMCISGAAFPLCGVMVLRLNLVPMRYMLMHGVILGGAISLALSLPLVPVSIVVNLALIYLMMIFTRDANFGFSGGSAASMVLSMALASIIMHVSDVPAKDTLSLMWGSPFALTKFDIIILLSISVLLVLYVVLNFHNILALFFNREIAQSIGLNVKVHYTVMICVIALIVAVAMKLLGAFLIDSLLILPVLSASAWEGKKSKGIKGLFVRSSIIGFALSVIGFTLAVILNWPPAATISGLSGILYIIFVGIRRIVK